MDLTKTGRMKRVSASGRVTHKKLSDPGMMLRRRTGFSERVRVRAREMSVPTGSVTHAARVVAGSLPVVRIAILFGLVLFASLGIFLGVSAYAKAGQMNVRIENGPVKMNIVTSARTVKELLEQKRIRVGPYDEVTPPKNTKLSDGMVVMVNRAIIIFVKSKGSLKQLYMTGGTVEDALARAEVSFDQDDKIEPPLDTALSAGMSIEHVAVEVTHIIEKQNLKFKTVYENTNTLLKGKTQLKQSGTQGIQRKTVEVVYMDGEEVSRKIIEDIREREPVNRIVMKGTGVPPKPTTKPSSGNSGSGSNGGSGNSGGSGSNGGSDNNGSHDGSDNYGGHYSHVRPQDLVIPAVPTAYTEVRYMQLTAYTHTGRKTACGNWPQYTRTREKPGTIAVDPKAIPYGTLLYVTGYGYCIAEDTGSNKVDSSRMGDLFMNTRAECMAWGRRRNVAVYIIEENHKR